MRGELLDTQGMFFEFTKINQGIEAKILDLRDAGEDRKWNDIAEAHILSEMEELVSVRKILVESGFPYRAELQILGELISKMVTYTHWE